jgi:hypothetical protein
MMMIPIISAVRKPICPTFIHDDQTRIIVLLVALPILIAIHWGILRYFNVK